MQGFQNYIDRMGLVKAELKCDQEPSTPDVANTFVRRCQSTTLVAIATQKSSNGSLGREGPLRAFREAVSLKYKTEIGPEHVPMGWMGRKQCMGRKQFSSERISEDAIS